MDASEVKRLRKAAKKAAAESAAAECDPDADPAEAKSLRKAAKRAAAEATAAQEEWDALEAKRPRKEEKLSNGTEDATAADADELDAAEAKRRRKAEKRAAAEAASVENAVGADEVDASEKKKQRKAAKKEAENQEENGEASVPKVLTAEEIEERRNKRKERKKKEREAKKTRTDEMTVFVTGLPFDDTEETLRKHFSSCGEVIALKLLLKADGSPRGIGYISYSSSDEAQEALKFDGKKYKGKELTVKPSVVKPKSLHRELEVIVKHFPRDAPDDALRKVFAPCGAIESLKIPRWDDGAAKGMAFIVFKDQVSLKKALKLDRKQMGEKWIEVKKSSKDHEKAEGDGKPGGEGGKGGKGKGGKFGKGKGKGKSKGKKK